MLSKNRKKVWLESLEKGKRIEARLERQARPGQAGLVQIVCLYPKNCGKPFLGSHIRYEHHLDCWISARLTRHYLLQDGPGRAPRRVRVACIAISNPRGRSRTQL